MAVIDTVIENVVPPKTRIARKDYPCNACETWMECGWGEGDITKEESDVIHAAKLWGYKIHKGDTYHDEVNTDGSYIYHYRAKPNVLAILNKYNLHPDL